MCEKGIFEGNDILGNVQKYPNKSGEVQTPMPRKISS